MDELNNTFIRKIDMPPNDIQYITHWNGDRPYKILANKNGIYVYKNIVNSKNGDIIQDVPLMKFTKFYGYWNGFDLGMFGTNAHGNTILLQEDMTNYIYIGDRIYSFETTDTICDYVSPLGNSDVPYPVAYGSTNIYFMLDIKYVAIDQLSTPISVHNANQLYSEFYGHCYKEKQKCMIKHDFNRLNILDKKNINFGKKNKHK